MNSVRQDKSIRDTRGDYRLESLGLNSSYTERIHAAHFVTHPSHAGSLVDGISKSDLKFSTGLLSQGLKSSGIREQPHCCYFTFKRIGDVIFATGALLVLLPVMLVVALLVYAEDGGPVLYHQERVGKGGRRFKFFKFRSMVRNADALKAKIQSDNEATGPIFKMKKDPRITRIGRVLRRYSIDELPQLWNVVIGDMSLVGPRPHLPEEVAQYRSSQHLRLKVQPGLLCLREVSGRSRLTFEQWVELDLAYIQRQSLRLDLCILCLAVPAILKADGAF